MRTIPATSQYTEPIPSKLSAAAIQVYAAMYSKDQAEGGALIDIAELRLAAGLSKRIFDAALLALAGSGRVQLQSHSLPYSLTAREKADLIPNGRGSYFLAAGIRF